MRGEQEFWTRVAAAAGPAADAAAPRALVHRLGLPAHPLSAGLHHSIHSCPDAKRRCLARRSSFRRAGAPALASRQCERQCASSAPARLRACPAMTWLQCAAGQPRHWRPGDASCRLCVGQPAAAAPHPVHRQWAADVLHAAARCAAHNTAMKRTGGRASWPAALTYLCSDAGTSPGKHGLGHVGEQHHVPSCTFPASTSCCSCPGSQLRWMAARSGRSSSLGAGLDFVWAVALQARQQEVAEPARGGTGPPVHHAGCAPGARGGGRAPLVCQVLLWPADNALPGTRCGRATPGAAASLARMTQRCSGRLCCTQALL